MITQNLMVMKFSKIPTLLIMNESELQYSSYIKQTQIY
jgi:hypothetical protein